MDEFQIVLVKSGKQFSWCSERGDFRDYLEKKLGIPISIPDKEIDRHDPKFVELVRTGGYEVDHLKVVYFSNPEYCILYDENGNEFVASKDSLNLKDARIRTRYVTAVREIRVPSVSVPCCFPPTLSGPSVPSVTEPKYVPPVPKGPFQPDPYIVQISGPSGYFV